MGIFTINNAQIACPSLSTYNLALTIVLSNANTGFTFRPQDLTGFTAIDWGDCTVNSGTRTHTYTNPGTYQIRVQATSLGLTFYNTDSNIQSIDRFPGVIDIPNAPALNNIPINWGLFRNKLAGTELTKLFTGLNIAFPTAQNYGFPDDFVVLIDAQNNSNKVMTQAGIDQAYQLIDKKWFLNYAINAVKASNRYMIPSDSNLFDTAGELGMDANGAVMSLVQNSLFINSNINLNTTGAIVDAKEELYVRMQFQKPGETSFGHTIWTTYNRVTNTISPFPITQAEYPEGTLVRGVFEKKYGTYYGGQGLIPNTTPYVITLTYPLTMSYDNFFVESTRTTCGVNSSSNAISFNSSGGYRTGVNYTGNTPVTLKLLSFNDTMVELTSGGEVTLTLTPSVLIDGSTNPITYPYNVTLPSSSVSNVGVTQSAATPEITCPSNSSNQVRRRRIITYQVIDINGIVGPTKTSELDILYTPQTLPTSSFFYQGIWAEPDSIHHPEVNCWVDYLDEFGVQQREVVGGSQNGCVEIIASSIVDTNGVHNCTA